MKLKLYVLLSTNSRLKHWLLWCVSLMKDQCFTTIFSRKIMLKECFHFAVLYKVYGASSTSSLCQGTIILRCRTKNLFHGHLPIAAANSQQPTLPNKSTKTGQKIRCCTLIIRIKASRQSDWRIITDINTQIHRNDFYAIIEL